MYLKSILRDLLKIVDVNYEFHMNAWTMTSIPFARVGVFVHSGNDEKNHVRFVPGCLDTRPPQRCRRKTKTIYPLTIVRHIHICIRPRPIWNTRLPSKPLLCARLQLGEHNGWTISGLGLWGAIDHVTGVGRRRISRYYFDTVSTEMGNPLCRELEKHSTVSRWFCTAHRTAVRVPVVNNCAASRFLC